MSNLDSITEAERGNLPQSDTIADVGDDIGEWIGDDVGDDVGEWVGIAIGDDIGEGIGDGVGDDVGDGIGLRQIAPLGFRMYLYFLEYPNPKSYPNGKLKDWLASQHYSTQNDTT